MNEENKKKTDIENESRKDRKKEQNEKNMKHYVIKRNGQAAKKKERSDMEWKKNTKYYDIGIRLEGICLVSGQWWILKRENDVPC